MGRNRTRFKGHCGLCALQAGTVRGMGYPERAPMAEKRLVGRTRRFSRRAIPADQQVR